MLSHKRNLINERYFRTAFRHFIPIKKSHRPEKLPIKLFTQTFQNLHTSSNKKVLLEKFMHIEWCVWLLETEDSILFLRMYGKSIYIIYIFWWLSSLFKYWHFFLKLCSFKFLSLNVSLSKHLCIFIFLHLNHLNAE